MLRPANAKTAFMPTKTADLLVLDCMRSEWKLVKAVVKVAEKRVDVAPLVKEQSRA